jgi:hypothetical protein
VGTSSTYRSTLRFLLESLEGLALAPLIIGTWALSRRWLANWGSTPGERDRAWPGDDLAPAAIETYTRGIAISAPAEVVWEWVVQFGLDRAGFYSYELFERLVGIPVRNVEAILPEHQQLPVGSEIKLHPKAPGIPVGAAAEARHLCFGETDEAGAGAADPRRSWSIYIEPDSPTSCRLLLRSCIEGLRAPTLPKRVGLALDRPIDFVMEQRMLRTIRRLAESAAKSPGSSVS